MGAKKMKFNTVGYVIDRNGCKLFYPKNITQEQLDSIFNTVELYGVDNLLGKNWNVVDVQDSDVITFNLKVVDGDETMVLSMTSSRYLKMVDTLYKNNFSSVENFVGNLLPTFNGPDRACFVGLTHPEDGITYGFKFDIPCFITQ